MQSNQTINDFSRALELGNGVVYRRTYRPDTYEYISDYIEEITGYSAKEITPSIWSRMAVLIEQTGEFADYTLEETQRKFRSGEINSWQADIQIRTRSGEKRWISEMAVVLRDEEGTSIGCTGIFQDITMRKETERRMTAVTNQLQRRNQEMENDLIMASEVQQAFVTEQPYRFPLDVPPEKRCLNFHHRYIPATMLAGDFYEILPLSDHQAGIFICDVVGHGVRAALLTTFLRGLLEELIPLDDPPGKLLSKMNRSFKGVFGQTENFLFATALYMVVDLQSNTIHFANAGHPNPMRLNRESGMADPLETGLERPEPALGIIDDFGYSTVQYAPADTETILLYTDGLIEACDVLDRMYGEERLMEFLQKNTHMDPELLLDETILDVYRFSDRDELEDDACLLAIVPAIAN
jgi:sigma-B regulation protein RsbU (phosphoserine phosphatase)